MVENQVKILNQERVNNMSIFMDNQGSGSWQNSGDSEEGGEGETERESKETNLFQRKGFA